MNRFLGLCRRPAREIYEGLCKEAQTEGSPELEALSKAVSAALKKEGRSRKYAVYAAVELLRIVAPWNPFSDEEIEIAIKSLIKGAKEEEAQKALETVAGYKMVALISSGKRVNELAKLSLSWFSKKWAQEMLQSIIEEKEEEIGKETKKRVVEKAVEGNVYLESYIEKHRLLFAPAVKEIVLEKKTGKIELIKRFNQISKNIISLDLIEQCLDELADKKEFILFLSECTVRKEILQTAISLSEDRSAWIRCHIPHLLFKKARDTFYTAAAAAEIGNMAIEVWKKRMHDLSGSVRAGAIRLADAKMVLASPEAKQLILERVRDKERVVRKEALNLIGREFKEMLLRANRGAKGSCFICLYLVDCPRVCVQILASIFIKEYKYQEIMIRNYFSQIKEEVDIECKDIVAQIVFCDLLAYVLDYPEDIDTLILCERALQIAKIDLLDNWSLCEKHISIASLARKALVEDGVNGLVPLLIEPIKNILNTSNTSSTPNIPNSLLVRIAEKSSIDTVCSTEILSLLHKIAGSTDGQIFFRTARLITIAENNGKNGWNHIVAISNTAKEYVEIKKLAHGSGLDAEFSIDISKIINRSQEIAGNPSSLSLESTADREEQLAMILQYSPSVIVMLQINFLECQIRSAILEQASAFVLLNGTYLQHKNLANSFLFQQIVEEGIKVHADTEIRLLLTAISALVNETFPYMLSEKPLLELLSFLCWLFLAYKAERAPEVILSLLDSHIDQAKEFFSVFVNLKRLKIDDQKKEREMYILSEEVCSALERKISKIGVNPAQYTNEMPEILLSSIKGHGGWASRLYLADDNQFSTNILTTFKPKTKTPISH